MTITKENYEKFIEFQEELEQKILSVLEEKCMIETGRTYMGDEVIKFSYLYDKIEIYTEIYRYCGCCPNDTMEYSIPTSYLYDENWKEKVQREVKEKQELEAFLKEEKIKKQKEEQEKKEREQYENLRKKFE